MLPVDPIAIAVYERVKTFKVNEFRVGRKQKFTRNYLHFNVCNSILLFHENRLDGILNRLLFDLRREANICVEGFHEIRDYESLFDKVNDHV